jgi:hypothetical protein
LCLLQDGIEKFLRDVSLQQPLPILGEHRHIPHVLVHPQSYKPPVQQVEIQGFYQQPLTAQAVQRLQQ